MPGERLSAMAAATTACVRRASRLSCSLCRSWKRLESWPSEPAALQLRVRAHRVNQQQTHASANIPQKFVNAESLPSSHSHCGPAASSRHTGLVPSLQDPVHVQMAAPPRQLSHDVQLLSHVARLSSPATPEKRICSHEEVSIHVINSSNTDANSNRKRAQLSTREIHVNPQAVSD